MYLEMYSRCRSLCATAAHALGAQATNKPNRGTISWSNFHGTACVASFTEERGGELTKYCQIVDR
jgi:hypothetical protein